MRGTWSEAWDAILQLDPDLLAAYLRFSAVPWRKGHLEPKVKEFIEDPVERRTVRIYSYGTATGGVRSTSTGTSCWTGGRPITGSGADT